MIVSPYARSWQCGPALAAILPRPCDAPIFLINEGFAETFVEIYERGGIDYTVTRGVGWHTDWDQMFFFVCVTGSGTLSVENNGPRDTCFCTHMPVTRGTIIQLWADAYHKMDIDGDSMAFVQMYGPEGKMVFTPRQQQEEEFIEYISSAGTRLTVPA